MLTPHDDSDASLTEDEKWRIDHDQRERGQQEVKRNNRRSSRERILLAILAPFLALFAAWAVSKCAGDNSEVAQTSSPVGSSTTDSTPMSTTIATTTTASCPSYDALTNERFGTYDRKTFADQWQRAVTTLTQCADASVSTRWALTSSTEGDCGRFGNDFYRTWCGKPKDRITTFTITLDDAEAIAVEREAVALLTLTFATTRDEAIALQESWNGDTHACKNQPVGGIGIERVTPNSNMVTLRATACEPTK